MSKIHQAIRRAEREGRIDTISPTGVRKDTLEEIRKEFMQPRISENSSSREYEQDQKNVPVLSFEHINCASLGIVPDSKLVSLSAPKSFPSEQYRALKTKLHQIRNGGGLKTILITSAAASEGKTLTAVNLALTIAQEIDQKVLLVDADLRRPSVHKMLGLSEENGLADLLRKNLPANQIILKSRIPNLYITPAGSIPENPTELLNTQGMRDFLTSAAAQYDWVILDSPPFVPLADAELMSSLVDGILLVVRASEAPGELIARTVQALRGKNVLGVVFNCMHNSKKSSYQYYYYGTDEKKG